MEATQRQKDYAKAIGEKAKKALTKRLDNKVWSDANFDRESARGAEADVHAEIEKAVSVNPIKILDMNETSALQTWVEKKAFKIEQLHKKA